MKLSKSRPKLYQFLSVGVEYRLQDKGSRFVILDNQDYVEKIEYQLGRSSFEELDHDPSNVFSEKGNLWIQKWRENKVLDKNWSKFIE